MRYLPHSTGSFYMSSRVSRVSRVKIKKVEKKNLKNDLRVLAIFTLDTLDTPRLSHLPSDTAATACARMTHFISPLDTPGWTAIAFSRAGDGTVSGRQKRDAASSRGARTHPWIPWMDPWMGRGSVGAGCGWNRVHVCGGAIFTRVGARLHPWMDPWYERGSVGAGS